MGHIVRYILLLILIFPFSVYSKSNSKATAVFAVIETSFGNIRIKLFHDRAPKTVSNFLGLAMGKKEFVDVEVRKKVKKPYYNGLTFHRVVPGFVIQGGDPMANGKGGPGFGIDQEINSDLNFEYPGMVAMAAEKPAKNGSQFFITLKELGDLDGKFTIFGQVIDGFEVVKSISLVKRDLFDKPIKPVTIKNIRIIYK